MKRSIQISDQAGYCFGVRRALDLAREQLVKEGKLVYSIGPIIHNPQVVAEFKKKGLLPVESLEGIDEGILLIRSHGVEKELLEEAERKGLEIIDATCPFVKNAQRMARQLSEAGYQLVIVGEETHPEVKGILSYAGRNPVVVNSIHQLKGKSIGPKVGMLAQTTQSLENFIEVARGVLAVTYECRIFNTICNATASRQASAVELAGSVDVMFVVGGKNSANTTRLAGLCRAAGAVVYHIETADEIVPEMIANKKRIGITAGASTPRSQVDRVKAVLEEINTNG
ncbi:MAG: 4-hydroxy-3-methylbut-2-enyl diphosphate reductase [Candidatus Abyssobacteria bacterium SURF_5]|uniref:4-hydroxy-3-methylbut-2-enyl diphosphate reductase n=1 Tax=Abyssobacteria bacterium (strain SURF_5) TaxID=2093360 RepID=A0A3A4P9B9_ABYX5|nr:MAG: 4-hydroxy-3-methylbut-2-enyl diphosphate reductase [Candidatus Abyssubacteria bacterium SURF_5]